MIKNNHFSKSLSHLIILFLWSLLFCNVKFVSSANVLFFVGGISSHSHRVGIEPLANKLLDRGHNVTFISPAPSAVHHPKLNEFCPQELLEFYNNFQNEFGTSGLKSKLETQNANEITKGTVFFDGAIEMWRLLLNSPEFKTWINQTLSGPGFDLLVIDNCGNDAAYALAHKFKAKTMSYVSIGTLLSWDYDVFGIPSESSWVPDLGLGKTPGQMNVFDRIANIIRILAWYWDFTQYYMPKLDKLVRETLDMPDMPPLLQLKMEDRIVLANQHYSDSLAKSLPPFMVPIGGMHLLDSRNRLSQDLEDFIDGAGPEGFIYISFGSIINISTIPPELLQVFFDALKTFKMRFLWKWEGAIPKQYPENILFRPWFKQQDVLAHPKIRGFISQGGQVSLQQAIFNGVPLIILPVNGDQDFNAKRTKSIGNGLHLDFVGLTVENLKESIKNLTEDKKYQKMAKKLEIMSRDRPMSPVDTAVWWAEYVMRTDDMSLLKPLSINHQFWQTRLIDVWAIIFTTLIFSIVVMSILIFHVGKFFFKFLSKSSDTMKMVTKTIKDKSL